MGNTSELSFENAWSGSQNRPNHIVAEILNRDLHYGQDFVEDEHSSLNDPTVFEAFRSEPIRLEGIVRETQARRHIRQDLNFYNLIRQLGAFEVDLDAIGYEIGDAVWVSHDLPQWGFSGRIFNDSPATTVVYLDRAVTIEAATNYQVQVRDSSTGIIETANVDETATGGAGTYEAGSRIVLTAGFFFAPAKGDLYSWGQTTKVSNQFVIVDTELDPRTLRRRVRVIEYDPNVYESGFSERPASISALPAPATS